MSAPTPIPIPPPPPPPTCAPIAPLAPPPSDSGSNTATKPKWIVDVPVALDWKDVYPLHCQSQLGSAAGLASLIRADTDLNALDDDGWSMMHYAAWYGHTSVVDLLLSLGAVIDPRTVEGATPLHFAAGAGRIETTQRLLSAGAERKAKNKEKQTPIELVRQMKPDNWKEVEALLTEKAP